MIMSDEECEHFLDGRVIAGVRPMTSQEKAAEGWSDDDDVTAIELEDGGVLYASGGGDWGERKPGIMMGRNRFGGRIEITPGQTPVW